MSGIYIKGMEMPVGGCVNCIFCVYDRCLINLKLEKKASVTHGCPLVPVPDHGRLIDADALMQHEVFLPMDGGHMPIVYASYVSNAPTIIPADPAEEGEG